ncbi:glutathione peroxidase [Vibrio xiamenensis]|uniref:Glutathione peroxidase n=1 Tax=Vibrio xiamenensis TaxID=861298 RepID=A0A1G7XBV9_9VIBR|nr:redoxin domain-containing protein [Vibrio xiamenensis]SDG81745.1 glutathione peroxidase [Vibrio xiamenensis]
MSAIYDIEVTSIDGKPLTLAEYQGKVLLVVNVASECGLTPQYEALEALYKEKKSQGLEVLGFPCNQFGAQEPGSEAEIQSFCTSKFGIEFPMFSKIDVNGDNRHPLYTELLNAIPERTFAPDSGFVEKLKGYGIEGKEGDILWNFEKFLINKQGEVVAHFAPDMAPDHELLQQALNKALAE